MIAAAQRSDSSFAVDDALHRIIGGRSHACLLTRGAGAFRCSGRYGPEKQDGRDGPCERQCRGSHPLGVSMITS